MRPKDISPTSLVLLQSILEERIIIGRGTIMASIRLIKSETVLKSKVYQMQHNHL